MLLPLTYLRRYEMIYLASPYTKYRRGPARAMQEVAVAAARLLKLVPGMRLFCPITHSRPIAEADPSIDTHDTWMPIDEALASACEALVIADMDGWHESRGVLMEIDFFRREDKSVYLGLGLHSEYLRPDPVLVRLEDAIRLDAGNLAAGTLRGRLAEEVAA